MVRCLAVYARVFAFNLLEGRPRDCFVALLSWDNAQLAAEVLSVSPLDLSAFVNTFL
jgi:hypothetical protein